MPEDRFMAMIRHSQSRSVFSAGGIGGGTLEALLYAKECGVIWIQMKRLTDDMWNRGAEDQVEAPVPTKGP
jgi:hypothetical protein